MNISQIFKKSQFFGAVKNRKKTCLPQKGIIQKLKTASFGGFKRSKSIKKKTVEEGRPKERVIFEDDPLEKANDLLEAKNRELRYAVKMKVSFFFS